MRMFKCIRMLYFDIRYGVSLNIWKYICVFFLYILASSSLNLSAMPESIPSFWDYLLYIQNGLPPYIPSNGDYFKIPYIWLMIQIFCIFIVYHYPRISFDYYGDSVFIRTDKRSVWWTAKYIWIIISVLLFYLIGYFGVFMMTELSGQNFTSIQYKLNREINGLYTDGISIYLVVLVVIIIPILHSIMVSVAQMFLSFIWNPVYSYLLIIVYTVISVYYYSFILLGDVSMLQRSSVFLEGGKTPLYIIATEVMVLIFLYIAGTWYFSKVDILKREE